MDTTRNKQRWLALWQRIGAKGDAHEVYKNLSARYKEPHRYYHTILHIEHCLAELEQVKHLTINSDAVEIALWYHDAIYDTRAKDNEEKSAALARTVLRNASLSDAFLQLVEDLILATKHISPQTDPDARLIADIDLSFLGLMDEIFDENGRQIRQEYEWVPKELFATGRLAFLKSLLERPAIYSTRFFRDNYETQARQNIARAIAQLS